MDWYLVGQARAIFGNDQFTCFKSWEMVVDLKMFLNQPIECNVLSEKVGLSNCFFMTPSFFEIKVGLNSLFVFGKPCLV